MNKIPEAGSIITMKKLVAAFMLIIFFLLFQSAVFAEKIVLVTDPYWNGWLERDISGSFSNIIKKRLAQLVPFYRHQAVRIGGKRVERFVIEVSDSGSTADRIEAALASAGADIAVMSPLASAYACTTAEKFPDTYFIITEPLSDSECSGGNISKFEIDYGSAFFQAGEWAASQSDPVHALFFTGGTKYRDEAESFRRGWSGLKEAGKLNITEFSRIDDADAAFIAEFDAPLLKEGGIAVLFAGPRNETVASRLDGSPAVLVTEHSELWADSGYDIAASVEAGPAYLLSSILKSISTETYRNGGVVEAEFFTYDSERKKKKI